MTPYDFTNMTNEPNLEQIQADVEASAMTHKEIEDCTWHQKEAKLTVCMEHPLDTSDEAILAQIVEDNA